MVTSFLSFTCRSVSNLVAPFEHFFTQYRILLKAAGLTMCGSRPLDVPIAEAEFSDRTQVFAAGTEFTAE